MFISLLNNDDNEEFFLNLNEVESFYEGKKEKSKGKFLIFLRNSAGSYTVTEESYKKLVDSVKKNNLLIG